MRIHLASIMVIGIVQSTSVLAEHTDVVELANGDRITGEIKGLQRGLLQFKTDHMSTVYIEWDKVAQIQSDQLFEVELASGERLFGSLAHSAATGRMRVDSDEDQAESVAAIIDTIRIAPIEEGGAFRQRLDGYLNLGFSFTKATDLSQFTLGTGFSYRDRVRLWDLELSSIRSDSAGAGSSARHTLNAEQRRFFGHRWFWSGLLQFTRNDELGLDLRTLLGGGVGRYLLQSNRQELAALGGLAVAREEFEDGEQRESVELLLGLGYDAFRFDTPELDVSAGLLVFPSLTVSGRVRAEASLRFRYELVEDLFAELSLVDSYDSEPQVFEAEKNDYSVTTSLGYRF